jgi:formylglycine-generating enzyme required for sulfatase activity
LGLALCSGLPLARAGEETAGDPPIPALITIPEGPFWSGSDEAERELGYRLDERAYGHSRTRERKWYAYEYKKKQRHTEAYRITRTLITNRHYQDFVAATGHPVPDVDEATWRSYGLIHPYARTRRHAWIGGEPPEGRPAHPVVLVSHDDARAYATWLSEVTGLTWRLPTWQEWEKAARGLDGRVFPWGDDWDPARLNSHDEGPFDTLPVGSFPEGASPFGLLDPAGQVFEWTASETKLGRFEVRGGSWDDSGCGVCRPAARHSRPQGLKHILIGFRLTVSD